jgi:hypothetical protein
MVDPYLAQRDMELSVSQNLREAEHRSLARTAGANRELSLGRLATAVSAGFGRAVGRARSAAGAVRTWYNETVEPYTNAAN